MIKSHLGDLPSYLEKTFMLSYTPNQRYKQLIFTFFNVMMILTCAVSIYFLGLLKSLEGTAYFVAVGAINCSQHVIYSFRQKGVKKILGLLLQCQKQHKEQWEKDMFQRDSEEIWNVIHTYIVILLSYLIFYFTLPCVLDIIIGNIVPDYPSLRVQMPCEGFLNFLEPRKIERFILTILIIIWCYAAIAVHSGIQVFILVSIMYTKIELKIIAHKLSLLKNILNEKGNDYQYKSEQMFRDIILHHQMTFELLENIITTSGLPLVILTTTISLCFCFNFYCILTLGDKGSFSARFNGIGAIMCTSCVLYYLCYFGESLEEENHRVFNGIYDLPWYNEKGNFRNTVLIMMRQAQKPFVINYRLMANLNLHSFMQIVNTSYSYFMMLKSIV